jgi:hypothetical protein
MPQKLTTTVNKITTVPNSVNTAIIDEFYQYTQIRYQTVKKNCFCYCYYFIVIIWVIKFYFTAPILVNTSKMNCGILSETIAEPSNPGFHNQDIHYADNRVRLNRSKKRRNLGSN